MDVVSLDFQNYYQLFIPSSFVTPLGTRLPHIGCQLPEAPSKYALSLQLLHFIWSLQIESNQRARKREGLRLMSFLVDSPRAVFGLGVWWHINEKETCLEGISGCKNKNLEMALIQISKTHSKSATAWLKRMRKHPNRAIATKLCYQWYVKQNTPTILSYSIQFHSNDIKQLWIFGNRSP